MRDATGRDLRAWMEGFSGPGTLRGIRIVFEDGDAVYPVSIDPTVAAGVPAHWRVRLRYRQSTTPFQQRGRWLTTWGGWNETMLRTEFVSGGRVPDGSTGSPLLVAKASGAQTRLDWGASCRATDTDCEICEGIIGGNFSSHASRFCSTSGALTATFAPSDSGSGAPRRDAPCPWQCGRGSP